MSLFDDVVFNTQNPETALSRINNTLERPKSLLNSTAIENVSQFAQDRILALANRLNNNDINKTLGKITLVDYPTGNHPERDNPKQANSRNETAPETNLREGRRR